MKLTKTERLLRSALISIADTAGFDGETFDAESHKECVNRARLALAGFKKLQKQTEPVEEDGWQ